MDAVTISPKFQVVIPKAVREQMNLRPGQKVQVFGLGDHIEIVPFVPVSEMRGFLRGIATDIPREEDRVL